MNTTINITIVQKSGFMSLDHNDEIESKHSITELLENEAIHVSWSYFEQQYHFIQSIYYHSVRVGFSSKLLKNLINFLLTASDPTIKQNRLPVDQVELIFNNLHPNRSALQDLDSLIELLVKKLSSIETWKIKSAIGNAVTRFLIIRRHPSSSDFIKFEKALNLCDIVFKYCVDHFLKMSKKHMKMVVDWFSILASPDVLEIRKNKYMKTCQRSHDRFLSLPFDTSLQFVEDSFQKIRRILILKNPYLHYHAVEGVEEWLMYHDRILKQPDEKSEETSVFIPILVDENILLLVQMH